MDMLYTNMMSTLKPGRCRYGLMCNENGFLMDDGVVARLDDDTFLCHTTTGGAESVHGHMEDWLQCEWWDWKVYTANVTEQYAQVGVAGPNSRKVIEKLTDDDISAEALSFMGWKEITVAGIPARVFRISFAGELSFELAVPASHGRALWDALMEAGTEYGVAPYGTEAMHVMRAEKGFHHDRGRDRRHGDPAGPQHGLGDFEEEGRLSRQARARAKPHGRPQSLETGGAGDARRRGAARRGLCHRRGPQRQRAAQRAGARDLDLSFAHAGARSIAMGLVLHGPDRMGEVLEFPKVDGGIMKARIVDQVFYDKDGEKQNG